jgi:hypothetical protein
MNNVEERGERQGKGKRRERAALRRVRKRKNEGEMGGRRKGVGKFMGEPQVRAG